MRAPVLRAYLADPAKPHGRKKRVNLFAGGGGASLGELLATGRSPDVAINHWPAAIAIHQANHPTTRHYIEDVFEVDPLEATGGQPVEFLWLSPTCAHFSRAKGRALRDRKIRAQADVIRPWIEKCRPDVIVLENVPEFETWGPLIEEHIEGCPGDANGSGCSSTCRYGYPDKEHAGETYREWRDWIIAQGYSFEARILIAWEYGAPTTRPRLYIVMRADGQPATWPAPTHARVPSAARPHRWRTAADVIDWSIPCPSIFNRNRPLVTKTEARIVRGVGKFVLEAQRPFLISVNHENVGHRDLCVHDLEAPTPTITDGQRSGHALIVPYMVHRSNGERPGQAPRIYDVQTPHPTVVAGGLKTSLVAVFLAKHYGERRSGEVMASAMDTPLGVVTAQDHHALVAAHVATLHGTLPPKVFDQPDNSTGVAEWSDEVAHRARLVYRLMIKHGYAGPGLDHAHELVTLIVGGLALVIYDLGMRMLIARELYRAQGFPDWYVIDPIGSDGKRLSKTAQIRACGNSVCPPVARAIIRAVLRIDDAPPTPESPGGELLSRAA